MNWPVLFLAADPLANPTVEALKKQKTTALLSPHMLWFLGAILALVVVLLIWALFLRRRRDGEVLYRSREDAHREDGERFGSSGRKRRRKRRPDHPSNLRRNPTLAEAGGLPPLRPKEPDAPPTV
jgi:hypothetical protein